VVVYARQRTVNYSGPVRKVSKAELPDFSDPSGEGTVELQLLPEHALAISEDEDDQVAARLLESGGAAPVPAPRIARGLARASGAEGFSSGLRTLAERALEAAAAAAKSLSQPQGIPRLGAGLRTLFEGLLGAAATAAKQLLRARDAVQFGGGLRVLGLAVLSVAAVLAIWGIAHQAMDRNPPTPAEETNAVAAPVVRAAPTAESKGPPVRMTNPFDRSEVFEFPPGTSRKEARKAVSEILLQRANERGPQLARMRHKGANHAAPVRAHDSSSHQPTAH